ncbi:MAG TPA: response regulator [Woeseiaceae bacterium]
MSAIILVVDEDPDTRLILRALLERDRFAVMEAASAIAAQELIVRENVDLVILNHPMPLDGRMTLTAWLRTEPSTQAVPIINLTSRVIPAFLEEARELGVAATMTKPLDISRLLELVRQHTASAVAH